MSSWNKQEGIRTCTTRTCSMLICVEDSSKSVNLDHHLANCCWDTMHHQQQRKKISLKKIACETMALLSYPIFVIGMFLTYQFQVAYKTFFVFTVEDNVESKKNLYANTNIAVFLFCQVKLQSKICAWLFWPPCIERTQKEF